MSSGVRCHIIFVLYNFSLLIARHESMTTTLIRAFLFTTNQAKELTILIYCDFSFQIKLFLFKNIDIG